MNSSNSAHSDRYFFGMSKNVIKLGHNNTFAAITKTKGQLRFLAKLIVTYMIHSFAMWVNVTKKCLSHILPPNYKGKKAIVIFCTKKKLFRTIKCILMTIKHIILSNFHYYNAKTFLINLNCVGTHIILNYI